MTHFPTQGGPWTSGWVRSALPMGEVQALPGDAGRDVTLAGVC